MQSRYPRPGCAPERNAAIVENEHLELRDIGRRKVIGLERDKLGSESVREIVIR